MSKIVGERINEKDKSLTAVFEGHPLGLVPDPYISRATGVSMPQIVWYRGRHNIPRYRPTRCAGRPHSPLMHLGQLLIEKGEAWAREWAGRAVDKSIIDSIEQALIDRIEVDRLAKAEQAERLKDVAHRRRSKTYNARRLTKEEIEEAKGSDLSDIVIDRPKVRSDCINGLRPCPYASCKFNLFSDVSSSGSLIINRKRMTDPSELEGTDSCALDIADRGGATLEEVGDAMGLTRERVRQIEAISLEKLRDVGVNLRDLF